MALAQVRQVTPMVSTASPMRRGSREEALESAMLRAGSSSSVAVVVMIVCGCSLLWLLVGSLGVSMVCGCSLGVVGSIMIHHRGFSFVVAVIKN
jgi:hypothetical protein